MPPTFDVTGGVPVEVPSEANVNEDVFAKPPASTPWLAYGLIALALYFIFSDGGTFHFESEGE